MLNTSLLLASGDIGIIALGIVVFVIALAIAAGTESRNRKVGDNLRATAARFNATFPSSLPLDRLEISVDGVPAALTYELADRNDSTPVTQIRFLYVPPGVLRVVPERFFATLRKMFGAQDLEFGDPDFDHAFLVQGGPEAWVREVLEPGTRLRILKMNEVGHHYVLGLKGVSLVAGPSGVTISCPRSLVQDRAYLDAFIDLAILVFRQLRSAANQEIKILSAEEHVERGDCPVCANPLGSSPRRCPACGTLHHPDCWDYFGGCAIYACGRRGGRR